MMKKLLFYLLMLPLLCVLAACGEDEPNPDNPEETVPDPAGTNSPPVRRACTTDRGGRLCRRFKNAGQGSFLTAIACIFNSGIIREAGRMYFHFGRLPDLTPTRLKPYSICCANRGRQTVFIASALSLWLSADAGRETDILFCLFATDFEFSKRFVTKERWPQTRMKRGEDERGHT